MLFSLFRVLSIKCRSKVVDYSIVIFCLNVEYVDYSNPTTKTLIVLLPQWHHLIALEVMSPFFIPYFPYSFHCFSLIMLVYFSFFLPVSLNCNVPTSLLYAKDMSSWYHILSWYLCKELFTISCLTGNIFLIVTSYFISLISVQNRHSVVQFWVQS